MPSLGQVIEVESIPARHVRCLTFTPALRWERLLHPPSPTASGGFGHPGPRLCAYERAEVDPRPASFSPGGEDYRIPGIADHA